MLVHGFGILCKAIPVNIFLDKTTSLILFIFKLHNFCITEREVRSPADAQDNMHIIVKGGLSLPFFNGLDGTAEWNYNYRDDRLNELFDGGECNDSWHIKV